MANEDLLARLRELNDELGVGLDENFLSGKAFTPAESEAPKQQESFDRTYLGDLGAEAIRGLKQGVSGVSQLLGASETAKSWAESAAEIPYDANYQKDLQLLDKITREQGQLEGLKFLATKPYLMGLLTSNMLGQIAPAIGAAGATALSGGSALAVAGVSAPAFGALSAGSELNDVYMDTLGTLDPDRIEEALKDPEYRAYVNEVALKRGIVDTVTAGISGGVAGRVAPFVPGSGALSKIGKAAAEGTTQAAIGGTGEYIAQQLTGREDPAGLLLETVLEFPGALVEAPFYKSIRERTGGKNDVNPEFVEDDSIGPDNGTVGELEAKTPEAPQEEKEISKPSEVRAPGELVKPGTYVERIERYSKKPLSKLQADAISAGVDPYGVNGKAKLRKDLAKEIADKVGLKVYTPETAVPTTQIQLPKDLRQSKPRYKTEEIEFPSDVEKALYIISNKSKTNSKRNEDFVNWLKDVTGLSTPELQAESMKIRAGMKTAPFNDDGTALVAPRSDINVSAASPFVKELKAVSPTVSVTPEKERELIKLRSIARESAGMERDAAIEKYIDELKNSGFFSSLPVKDMKAFVENANPGATEYVREILDKQPELASQLMRTAVLSSLKSPAKEGEPKFLSDIRASIGPVKSKGALSATQETPEQYDKRVASNAATASTVAKFKASELEKKYMDLVSDDARIAKFSSKDFEGNYGDLGPAGYVNLFWSSVPSLARQYPFLGKVMQMFIAKARTRRVVGEVFSERLQNIVDTHGLSSAQGAAYVLDAMSGPHNKGKDQELSFSPDGRLRFKDFDGKRKLADVKTTAAVKDLVALNDLRLSMFERATFGVLRSRGFQLPKNATVNDVAVLLEQEKVGGTADRKAALEKANEFLNYISYLRQNKLVYFPHTRVRGQLGISAYVVEEGKKKLVGFYSVKTGLRGKADSKDLALVQKRIQEDMKRDGRSWVSVSGGPINQATPFKLNPYNMKEMVGRSKIGSEGYELLSSLLTRQGVSHETIESVIDSFDTRGDIEKMYVGFRDKENIYGYDTEDRLGSFMSSGMAGAASLSNYLYNTPLNSAKNNIAVELNASNAPDALKKLVSDYFGYNQKFGDDAAFLRALNYNWFMFANVSSAAMQLVSPITVTVPSLMEFSTPLDVIKWSFAAPLQSVPQIFKTYKLVGKFTPDNIEAVKSAAGVWKLSEAEAKTIMELHNRGVFSESVSVESATGLPSFAEKRNKNPVIRKINQMIPFVEEAARIQSAHILYNVLSNDSNYERALKIFSKDNLFKAFIESEYGGKPSVQALVHFKILENHGYFGKESRSKMLSIPALVPVFALTNYVNQMMELTGRWLFGRDSKGPTLGSVGALAALAVTAWMYGGVKAVPGEQPLDWFTKFYQKQVNGRKADLPLIIGETLKGWGWSDTAIRYAQKGVVSPATGGVMYIPGSRIGINPSTLPVIEQIFNVAFDPSANVNPADLMGAPGTILKGGATALAQYKEGVPLSDVTAELMPTAVKNIIRARQLSTGDLRSAKGDILSTGVEKKGSPFTAYDALSQALGIAPEKLADLRETKYETGVRSSSYNESISNHYKLAAQAYFSYKKGRISKAEFRETYAKNLIEAVKKSKKYKDLSEKEAVSTFKQGLKREVQSQDPFSRPSGVRKGVSMKDTASILGSNPELQDYLK